MIEKTLDMDSTIEIYNNSKLKFNERKFEGAANLFLKAAINFVKLDERTWAARTYGRVAWSKMELGDFGRGDSFLETSKQLDFNQAILNYMWTIYKSSKKNKVQIARRYLLDSVSMIYHEKNYSFFTLKKHFKKLDEKQEQLIWQLFNDFYAYNIKKERKTHPNWSTSDDSRSKIFLSHLTSMKENNVIESLENAKLFVILDDYNPEDNKKTTEKIENLVESNEVIDRIKTIISYKLEEKKKINIKHSIISIISCLFLYYMLFKLFGIEFVTIFAPIIGIVTINIKIWWDSI